MWHTPLGERVLRGAEGKLFQKALAGLVESVEGSPDARVGVDVFDRLTAPEKLASLERVAGAMLLEDVPAPELTAVTEGTVAAVYAHLLAGVGREIDEGSAALRKLVRRAAAEIGVLDDESPRPACDDIEQWRDLVDALTDGGIFWDRDWEAPLVDPDDPPDLAEHLRERLNLIPDYYTDVPPDPAPQRVGEIRQRLKALCRMKVA